MEAIPSPALRARDWLLLALYAIVLWATPLFSMPLMGIHETVHCVNTREMLATGDLVIPTYGGRPWLERPPLPFWITGSFVYLFGHPDADWAYRLGSIAAGLLTVLLLVQMVARQLGRNVALLAGLILITIREFYIYATNAEADIFLCAVVTLALAFFARAEFTRPLEDRDRRIFGTRPWEVLAFFVVLGLLNLTKGLFFGTLIAGSVVAAYLLLQRDWQRIQRYVWSWGVLAYVVVSLPWPLLAMQRCPGITELWESDYLGRMTGNFMREPWWYYLANLPYNLFPWTLPAFLGLWLAVSNRARVTDPTTARLYLFLLAWAIAPVLGLSLARGKHHHYLLSVTAPWAVFAALGTITLWNWAREQTLVSRHGLITLALLIVPVEVALYFVGAKLSPVSWFVPAMLVAWPAVAILFAWGVTRHEPYLAGAVVFGLLLVLDTGIIWFWDANVHRPKYQGDLTFMARIEREVAPDAPLLLTQGHAALEASWWIHHLRGRPRLLHNLSFLRLNTLPADQVYLIGRQLDAEPLREFGTVEVAFQSEDARWAAKPEQRWMLYRIRLRDDLTRLPPPIISPMQATSRAPGPELH